MSHPDSQEDLHHSLFSQMRDSEAPEAMKAGFLQPYFLQDFVQASPQDVGSRKRCSSRRLKEVPSLAVANVLAEQ